MGEVGEESSRKILSYFSGKRERGERRRGEGETDEERGGRGLDKSEEREKARLERTYQDVKGMGRRRRKRGGGERESEGGEGEGRDVYRGRSTACGGERWREEEEDGEEGKREERRQECLLQDEEQKNQGRRRRGRLFSPDEIRKETQRPRAPLLPRLCIRHGLIASDVLRKFSLSWLEESLGVNTTLLPLNLFLHTDLHSGGNLSRETRLEPSSSFSFSSCFRHPSSVPTLYPRWCGLEEQSAAPSPFRSLSPALSRSSSSSSCRNEPRSGTLSLLLLLPITSVCRLTGRTLSSRDILQPWRTLKPEELDCLDAPKSRETSSKKSSSFLGASLPSLKHSKFSRHHRQEEEEVRRRRSLAQTHRVATGKREGEGGVEQEGEEEREEEQDKRRQREEEKKKGSSHPPSSSSYIHRTPLPLQRSQEEIQQGRRKLKTKNKKTGDRGRTRRTMADIKGRPVEGDSDGLFLLRTLDSYLSRFLHQTVFSSALQASPTLASMLYCSSSSSPSSSRGGRAEVLRALRAVGWAGTRLLGELLSQPIPLDMPPCCCSADREGGAQEEEQEKEIAEEMERERPRYEMKPTVEEDEKVSTEEDEEEEGAEEPDRDTSCHPSRKPCLFPASSRLSCMQRQFSSPASSSPCICSPQVLRWLILIHWEGQVRPFLENLLTQIESTGTGSPCASPPRPRSPSGLPNRGAEAGAPRGSDLCNGPLPSTRRRQGSRGREERRQRSRWVESMEAEDEEEKQREGADENKVRCLSPIDKKTGDTSRESESRGRTPAVGEPPSGREREAREVREEEEKKKGGEIDQITKGLAEILRDLLDFPSLELSSSPCCVGQEPQTKKRVWRQEEEEEEGEEEDCYGGRERMKSRDRRRGRGDEEGEWRNVTRVLSPWFLHPSMLRTALSTVPASPYSGRRSESGRRGVEDVSPLPMKGLLHTQSQDRPFCSPSLSWSFRKSAKNETPHQASSFFPPPTSEAVQQTSSSPSVSPFSPPHLPLSLSWPYSCEGTQEQKAALRLILGDERLLSQAGESQREKEESRYPHRDFYYEGGRRMAQNASGEGEEREEENEAKKKKERVGFLAGWYAPRAQERHAAV